MKMNENSDVFFSEEKNPTISVIMCIYKEKLLWIKQAIYSVMNQSFKDFELIIVVDNPDVSENVKEYLNFISKSKKIVILFNEKNIGLAMSLNKGLSRARGEYIARMDSDDISSHNRFMYELEYLNERKLDVVSCGMIKIDENGGEIEREKTRVKEPRKFLPVASCLVHSGIMARKKVYEELNGYRDFKNSEDYDLWLRIVTDSDFTIGNIDKYLIKYRIVNEGQSRAKFEEQFYLSEYIRQLYKERKRTGKDSFSIDNYNDFLKNNIGQQDVKQSMLCLEKGIKALREVNVRAFLYFLKAYCCSERYMKYRLRSFLASFIC